jgi:hypothetical protein
VQAPDRLRLRAILEEYDRALLASAARLRSLGAEVERLEQVLRAEGLADESARAAEIRALVRAIDAHPSQHDDPGKAMRTLIRHTREALESFSWVLARPSRRPAHAPDAEGLDAAFVILSAGQLVEILPNGARGRTLSLERGVPVAHARTSAGIALGHEDGSLTVIRPQGRALDVVAEAREPESRWSALTEVLLGGDRLLAAVDLRGAVELWSPDLGEQVEVFRTEGMPLPTAALGDGGALFVAGGEGLLRRYRTAHPHEPSALLPTRDRAAITGLSWAGGSWLAATTDSGEVSFHDAADPDDLPWSWRPDGSRVCAVAAVDPGTCLAADESGRTWLVTHRSRTVIDLRVDVGPSPSGMARVGPRIYAATPAGVIHAFFVSPDGALGGPQRIELGEPVAALL